MLDLVDRLIIMDNQRIIIDGPKQAVLDELRRNDQARNKTTVQQKGASINKTDQPPSSETNKAKSIASNVENIRAVDAKNLTDNLGE